MRKRSGGITFFAVMAILFNGLSLMLFLFVVTVGRQLLAGTDAQTQAFFRQTTEAFHSPMGGLGVAIGVVGFVAGVGLLKLHDWARLTTLLLAGFGGVQSLVSPFTQLAVNETEQGAPLFLGALVGLAWHGLKLWYFLRPSVKAQFQPEATKA